MASSKLTDWLGQRDEEDVFEKDIEILDAHHHFWFAGRRTEMPQKYVNCYGERCPLHSTPYLPDDLVKDIASNKVIGTVYVECRAFYDKDAPPHLQSVGETRQVERFALEKKGGEKVLGILGCVDMTLEESMVEEALDQHMKASPRFRGIRCNMAWDSASDRIVSGKIDRDFLSSDHFKKNAKCLERRDLVLDIYVYHQQIPFVTDLAQALPNLTIVLNHCGGPLGIEPYNQSETLQKTLKYLRDLALCPNVRVKLGGLGMPQVGFAFHTAPLPPSSTDIAKAFSPWLIAIIDAFSAKRCMFESNFPMDKVTSSYTTLWNAFKRVAKSRYSEEDVSYLCSRTAIETYKLGHSASL